MKFGLRYCNTGRYVDPAEAIELVQAGEAAGFESAWTVEHTVVPSAATPGWMRVSIRLSICILALTSEAAR